MSKWRAREVEQSQDEEESPKPSYEVSKEAFFETHAMRKSRVAGAM